MNPVRRLDHHIIVHSIRHQMHGGAVLSPAGATALVELVQLSTKH
jgi:hypothetical protein